MMAYTKMININMRCIEIFLELREAMQNMD